MKSFFPLAFCAAAGLLSGCQDTGSSPVFVPDIPCQDADSLVLPRFSVTRHPKDTVLPPPEVIRTLPGTEWAKGDSVRAFFGGKETKLVFTLNRKMYLLHYGGASGEAELTQISRGDEALGMTDGSINSPLFSPDGKKIVFAGTTRGMPGFVLDAGGAGQPVRRVMLDQRGNHRTRITADPHFVTEGNRTWIYFATLSGLVSYSDGCERIPGGTYKVELMPTTGDVDSVFRTTGIPGAYRGGVSRNGKWAGTSYATSALFDAQNKSTIVLAGGEQQCNPSMNPYPPSAAHTDYMMILAFGGQPAYHLITGDSIVEGLHENLWIYNKDNKIIWRAKRPDENLYERYDKPEWSTDPDYATAIALRKGSEQGDLYVIKIGDIMNAAEGPLHQAESYLKIGSGGFTSDSYSHLWVEP